MAQAEKEALADSMGQLRAELAAVQEDAAAAKGLVTSERERAATLEKAREAAVQVSAL
jgi:hypothetical protein